MHDCAAFVVLDISSPHTAFERNLFRETLLFEVADGIVVGVGEEVHTRGILFNIILKVVHKMRTVTLRASGKYQQASDERADKNGRALTCSVPVMAQKTISANFCPSNGR